MSIFLEQVNKAQNAFAQGDFNAVIPALEQGFSEPFFNTDQKAQVARSVLEAAELAEQIIQFPSFQISEYMQSTIANLRAAFSEFLDGKEASAQLADATTEFRQLVAGLDRGVQLLQERAIDLHPQMESPIQLTLKQNEQGRVSVHLIARVSDAPGNLSPEEAQLLQNDFLKYFKAGEGDRHAQLNLAAQLMTGGRYQESLVCLDKLIEAYPKEAGSYLNLKGANYFYLGEFEKAIEFYLQALEAGEDAGMIDYNVWESCVELIKQFPEQKNKWEDTYYRSFPQGKHRF
ncbi:MAG: tetratricopeptide repeat protein [Bacteroidota bacterium]